MEGPHSTDEESEQESREQETSGKSRPFPKEIPVNSKRRKKTDGNKDKSRGSVQNEDEVLGDRSDRKDMNEDMSAQDEDDNDEDLDQLLVKAQHSLKRKAMFKEQANEPRFNFPKLETGLDTKNVYIRQQGTKAKIDMNTVVVVEKGNTGPKQKQQSTTLETCEINMNAHKVHVSKKQKQEEREKTAGKGWFDLPQQIMTPELKRDLQILKLRNVLDPKRFYKREDKGKAKFPKYFQIGTVIEGNTEFYSSRLTKKERATTITGEVMKDLAGREYYKRKFSEIQEAKQSGGKRFYKKGKGKGKQSKSWRAGK
ncbi:MAG: Fcf2 pre-rRNA processing-domain-containing protein [Benniella sp.]|nr:MAG: Fcf2 pre-rRNA processing-domain-containing protein [Benniella sp.]